MKWSIEQIPSLKGKNIVITGANSGIGFEAAKVFAAKGGNVILACRNTDKGQSALNAIKEATPDANLTRLPLDLASLDSVTAFSQQVAQTWDHLDILVNNAGVMAPPLSRTAEGFEMQFGTNHLGHFALTGKLLPLLEKSDDARIVVVSSLAHRFGRINFSDLNSEKRYLRWPAYAQSKLANLMFAKELQRRLQKQGSSVVTCAAHPGYSSTELQRYVPGNSLFNSLLSQTQAQGCLPTLYAATAPDIKGGEYIGPDGFFEVKGNPKRAYSTKRSNDVDTADRLWQVSEKLTQVSYLS